MAHREYMLIIWPFTDTSQQHVCAKSTNRIMHNMYRTDESSLLHLFLSSCVPVVSASELLCAVIVTCCIAKLTQGGLLYGGDRPGRCGKPCKHGTDHCHTEGLDCGYNRLQQRSLGWWEESLVMIVYTWNCILSMIVFRRYKTKTKKPDPD